MKILFTTNKKTAASTIFNLENLKSLNKISGVEFNYYRSDYANHDVILMMGYDFDIERARKENPKALIGVIDPRPTFKKQPLGADFILANGLEMEDYYYRHCRNIFKYYIYPSLDDSLVKEHKSADKIIIAYHGNKIHIEAAKERIAEAIERLGEEFDVELKAVYNIEALGAISWKPKNFKLTAEQWSENAYDEHLSEADIGIVPSLIPIRNESKIKKKAAGFGKKFNEDETDYLLRFKATGNAGRIFPFMSYGVPVVCDMFPSALQVIRDGRDGFIAHGPEAWHFKLRTLAANPELREKMGTAAREKFKKNYAIEILNRDLIEFLKNLKKYEKK